MPLEFQIVWWYRGAPIKQHEHQHGECPGRRKAQQPGNPAPEKQGNSWRPSPGRRAEWWAQAGRAVAIRLARDLDAVQDPRHGLVGRYALNLCLSFELNRDADRPLERAP